MQHQLWSANASWSAQWGTLIGFRAEIHLSLCLPLPYKGRDSDDQSDKTNFYTLMSCLKGIKAKIHPGDPPPHLNKMIMSLMTSSVESSLNVNHWQHLKYVVVILDHKEMRKHWTLGNILNCQFEEMWLETYCWKHLSSKYFNMCIENRYIHSEFNHQSVVFQNAYITFADPRGCQGRCLRVQILLFSCSFRGKKVAK